MIHGIVNGRNEAQLRIRLRGWTGIESDVTFLIDTGFSGDLLLPELMAVSLGFLPMGNTPANLADGSVSNLELYFGQMYWNGVLVDTMFQCIGNEPLIGMALLRGHELRIEVTPGGMVEVNELP